MRQIWFRLELDLDCDVLSVGHHGSATATSWDFLQATVPQFAVISCGAGNMYGHPDADTMEKLSDMGIQVYRTDEQGTIIASSDGSTISWNVDPCNDYTEEPASGSEQMVWISATGSKYHSIPDCGNMNPDKAYQEPVSQALEEGYEPCKKCF